jgi:hypothetical protein
VAFKTWPAKEITLADMDNEKSAKESNEDRRGIEGDDRRCWMEGGGGCWGVSGG